MRKKLATPVAADGNHAGMALIETGVCKKSHNQRIHKRTARAKQLTYGRALFELLKLTFTQYLQCCAELCAQIN